MKFFQCHIYRAAQFEKSQCDLIIGAAYKSCSADVRKHISLVQTLNNVAINGFSAKNTKYDEKMDIPYKTDRQIDR